MAIERCTPAQKQNRQGAFPILKCLVMSRSNGQRGSAEPSTQQCKGSELPACTTMSSTVAQHAPCVRAALLHQMIHQPNRQRLLSLDALAGEDELLGARPAHEPRQPLRSMEAQPGVFR